jgi:hypothetical protein
LREDHRLFERGEVTTASGLIPIDEMGKEALGPAGRGANDFVRKNTASDRKLDDAGIGCSSRVLKVDAGLGGRRVGQPIEGDVVEHFVARQRRV